MVIRPFSFKRSLVESISALRMLNVVSILQAAVMGWIFLSPTGMFTRPTHPPDPWWIAPVLYGIELWGVLFPIAAVFMIYATWTMKKLIPAHLFMAIVWGTFGMTWTIGGLTPNSSYPFYIGVVSLFLATHHVTMIRFWKVEE